VLGFERNFLGTRSAGKMMLINGEIQKAVLQKKTPDFNQALLQINN